MALRYGFRQDVGREPIDRRAGREPARIDPDHAPVIGLGGHVVRLRAQQRGSPGGQPRFRLRHIGARHLADVEAVARLFQLLGEHFDVTPVQVEDRLIAQQVHVGGGGVEQHLLLGDAQRLARAVDLAFRLPGAVGGLEAVEQRIGSGGGDAAREKCLGEWDVGDDAADRKLLHRIGVIITPLRGNAHLGAIAGEGLRHILVGRAQSRALRIERRIVLIGLHQGPFERVRRCPRTGQADAGRRQHQACNGPNIRPRPSYTHQATLPLALPASPAGLPLGQQIRAAANRADRRTERMTLFCWSRA